MNFIKQWSCARMVLLTGSSVFVSSLLKTFQCSPKAFKVKRKSFYIWKSFIFFSVLLPFPLPSLLLPAPKLQHAWTHTACAHIHMHTPTNYAEVLEVDCHRTSFLYLECSTQSTTIPSSFGLCDSVQNTRMLCLVPLKFP